MHPAPPGDPDHAPITERDLRRDPAQLRRARPPEAGVLQHRQPARCADAPAGNACGAAAVRELDRTVPAGTVRIPTDGCTVSWIAERAIAATGW
ncbi:hypothetical protein [Sciscionella marina]|uniref:hypothetical protein n=1 Tax=Sciscionella marina TaxID=508770 RepID=UPI000378A271|nr:hypothetical protein [Sciscionella marina]